MKIQYIKDNNNYKIKIEISEGTYIEKILTKEELLKIFNNLKSVLY